MTDVLTFHNDAARTGQTLNEQVLTLNNVNTNHFGKLWVLPTDEKVFAQPLYVGGLTIPGVGMRNVIYVATENDSVYAYDADSTNLFWHVSVVGAGEIPFQTNFCSIIPQIGITATPVIDRNRGPNGTIFVQAMSQTPSGTVYQRLHALDLATGQDTVPPVAINATYPGNGEDSAGGYVFFDPIRYVDRACLLLLNGVLYTAWSTHCDTQPSTSWVIGYNESDLSQASVMNLEPNGSIGSIWDSGGGPAADPQGNIYVDMGNGPSSPPPPNPVLDANGFPVNQDYDNAVVKLSVTNMLSVTNNMKVADYFISYNFHYNDLNDLDMASGAPVVLPPQTDSLGMTHQLVVTASKDQNVYLLDCTNMGKFNPNHNNVYQEITNVFDSTNNASPNPNGQAGGVWGLAAYFNNTVYFAPVHGPVTAFPMQNARLGPISSVGPSIYEYPGATPSVSANGSSNGIVWTVENILIGAPYPPLSGPAVFHAYAATNLAVELYNSTMAANGRDALGIGQKFNPPTVASGRVYVGTASNVTVFGLFDTSVLTPIQQWRNANFANPSDVGAGANSASPAGDGVPNLVKYALGLNPFTPVNPNQLSAAGIEQTNGCSYLTSTVFPLAAPVDVSLVAETSTDLINWTLGNATISNGYPGPVVATDNSPVGTGTNGFLRLGFVLNQ